MSTHPRFWLITCIVLAISSCSAFGQQAGGVLGVVPTSSLHPARDARPIAVPAEARGRIVDEWNSVPTALCGGSELAATCGDTLADVGAPSMSAMLCSAVGTFSILAAPTVDQP
jgi:hypothetical protein